MHNLSPTAYPSNKISTSKNKNRGAVVSNMQERLLKEAIIDPDFNENDDTQIMIQNISELQNIPPDVYKQNIYNSISNVNDSMYHTTGKNFSAI